MKKRILCLTLGLVLTFSQVVSVAADTRKEQLQQQKAKTESQLAEQEAAIDSLEAQKAQITAEISELDADLVDVMVELEVLESELTDKEAEIEQTKADLEEAETERDKQYEAMKLRIRYLYENGGDDAWAQMILQGEDIADILNQAEYVQKLYESDRSSLETFKETVQQVTDLGNQLESEKAELEEMQQAYSQQQASLESQLAEKRETSSNYDAQISEAQSQASAYAALIQQQNAEIQQIEEEEKKAAEEAARKAAEEQARREAEQQAAEEAAQQSSDDDADEGSSSNTSNNSNNNTDNGSGNTGNGESTNGGGSTTVEDDSDEGGSTDSGSSSSSGSVDYNPTGQAVVNYATQFVGNPYVWGGTSLTNGADCSGFIMSVYAHFGVSLPHSSSAMRSCGVGVSYSEAMPGDIICYSGHVAIYMGGGAIVHASNAKDGIKISSNAAYRTILAVRRVL